MAAKNAIGEPVARTKTTGKLVRCQLCRSKRDEGTEFIRYGKSGRLLIGLRCAEAIAAALA